MNEWVKNYVYTHDELNHGLKKCTLYVHSLIWVDCLGNQNISNF